MAGNADALNGKPVSLMKIGEGRCRWIVNEPPERALCCGAPACAGSWCAFHRDLVYVRTPVPAEARTAKASRGS
jgi:hypothetical protein